MKETVLITGASGGIGYELAKCFAREGYVLVLVARSGDRLLEIKKEFEQRYGVFVKVIEKDLSNVSAPQEIFEALQKDSHVIDFLVNNAAFGNHGFFVETDLRSELEMIQLNIASLTSLTKLFLKSMVERRSGRILNVSSTAAFQPGPLMAVYYASKAYVLSFSEALANELKGTGVSVTTLCPGPTRTGFQKRAAVQGIKLMNGGFAMDAGAVARDGYRAMMNGRPLVISGVKNRVIAFLVRFAPRNWATAIVRAIQDRKK